MDRRGGSKHEDSYKGHKAAGIDRRALRAHRRSLEWKSLRSDEANKRRNLSTDLSPVKEVKVAAQDSRRERLKKWQEERELKRKLQSQNSKKSVFKVTKVQHEYVPFKKPTSNPPPVAKVTKPTKASAPATNPTTRRSTRNEVSKPQKSESSKPPARVTRARSQSQTVTPVPPRKAAAKKPVQKAPPPVATTRTTRTRKSSQVLNDSPKPASKKTKAVVKKDANTTKPAKSKTAEKVRQSSESDVDINTQKINTRRGESLSIDLGSSSFKFTAPENVQPFVFKPLSPNSAAGFTFVTTVAPPSPHDRRCSTPKISTLKRSKVVQSPSASLILEQSTDASATDTNSDEDVKTMKVGDEGENPAAEVGTPAATNRNSSGAELASADKREKSVSKDRRKSRVQMLREEESDASSSESDNKSRRRSTRRSSVQKNPKQSDDAASMDTTDKDTTDEDAAPASSHSQRRSTRRSVVPKLDVEEMITNSADENDAMETGAGDDVALSEVPEEKMQDDQGKAEEDTATLETAAVVDDVEPAQEPLVSPHKSSPEQLDKAGANNEVIKELFATPAPLKTEPIMQKKPGAHSAERGDVAAFNTPATAPRRLRARSVTPANVSSIARRKDLRRSFVLKGLSPEEGVEILKLSPMIEIRRRTPKASKLGFAPVLDFSDIDEMLQAEAENPSTTDPQISDEGSKAEASSNGEGNKENAEPGHNGESTSDVEVKTVESSADQVGAADQEGGSDKDAGQEPADAEDVGKHDVKYFRDQMELERNRMTEYCAKWNEICENTSGIPDEVDAEIRTNVGKTELLMRGRFKQFGGLVDKCEAGAEAEGQTMTCMDLQGFWEMVYNQIDEVYNKFAKLKKMQSNNWVDVDKPKVVKKVLKKKPVSVKPVGKPAAAKSKFAAFRAKMLAQKNEAANADNTEVKVEEETPVQDLEEKKKTPAKSKFAEFRAKLLAEKKKMEEAEKAAEDTERRSGGVGDKSPPVSVVINKDSEQPLKVFEAGFFSVHSPVRKSSVPSLGASPLHQSLSRPRSAQNTPMSPMAKAVLERSAQFSARRSGSLGALLSASASGKLEPTPSDLCVPSPLVRDTSASGSFIANNKSWTQSCVTKADSSLFTPDAQKPSRRSSRSSRRSVQRPAFNLPASEESLTEPAPAETADGDDFLSKYLMPTSTIAEAQSASTESDVDQEMEVADETPISEDTHMAPLARTRLAAQFDVPLEAVLQTPAATSGPQDTSGTGRSRRRRSVHFSGPSDDENAHETSLGRAPVTPYNRDSIVPRKRVNSTSDKEQKENLSIVSTPPFMDGMKLLPISASPATRLSKLDVNAQTPITRAKKRFSGLPFTPPHRNVTSVLSSVDENDSPNLMCFSPLGSSAIDTPTRGTRRSTRLSINENSLL